MHDAQLLLIAQTMILMHLHFPSFEVKRALHFQQEMYCYLQNAEVEKITTEQIKDNEAKSNGNNNRFCAIVLA